MAIINNMPSGSSGKKYASGTITNYNAMGKITLNTYYDYVYLPDSIIGFKPSMYRCSVKYKSGSYRHLKLAYGFVRRNTTTTDVASFYSSASNSSGTYPTDYYYGTIYNQVQKYDERLVLLFTYDPDSTSTYSEFSCEWEAWE